jgi:catechol 2,3-dioxygenase-like lactoylglutathione lyase family enzyme
MRVNLTSVYVDDQARALAFSTDGLGFERRPIPLGDTSWLTVVSPEDPDGVELVLEPEGHPAAKTYEGALVTDGIPFTSFAVDDVPQEVDRLRKAGVVFTWEPLRGR